MKKRQMIVFASVIVFVGVSILLIGVNRKKLFYSNDRLFEKSLVSEKSVYYYEGNTSEGKVKGTNKTWPITFFIELYPDGRFVWSESPLSSRMSVGNYTIENGVLTLTNDRGICGNSDTYRFKMYNDRLEFIIEDSNDFPLVDVKDGERFFLDKNPTDDGE